jgi:hypothetical protein
LQLQLIEPGSPIAVGEPVAFHNSTVPVGATGTLWDVFGINLPLN